MAYHTFGPGLAIDHITMRGVPAMIARLEDADTGDPVQAYTLDDEPELMTVQTNRYGYFPQFQVDESVRRLRIIVGDVELIHGAWELIYAAEESAAASAQESQDSRVAAERAASLVEAPADVVVAELIRNEGTATQRILAGLYTRGGSTFVQPTPPPAGTTYEWEGARGNSISVKKQGGEIVARNLLRDPRFVRGAETYSPTRGAKVEFIDRGNLFPGLSPQAGNTVLAFGADESVGGSSYISYYTSGVTLENGKYYAASLWFQEPAGLTIPERYYMQFRNGGTNWGSSATQIINRQLDGSAQAIMAGRIEDATDRSDFWFVWWPSDLRNLPGETVKIMAPMISGPHDTEVEALDQVKMFFDGDTPDDRAHDVWFNTTDNREYLWNDKTKQWDPRGQEIDTSVAELITTSSDTRTALDTRYGNTAVAGHLTNAGATKTALDAKFTTADTLELERLQRERKLANQIDLVEVLRNQSVLGNLELVVTASGTNPAFSVHRVYEFGNSGNYAETLFASGNSTTNDEYHRIWETKLGDARATSTPGQYNYQPPTVTLGPVSNHEFALRIKPASHPAEQSQWVPRHNNINTAVRAAPPFFMTPKGRLRVGEGEVTREVINDKLDIMQSVYGRHPATGATNLIQVWTNHRFYPDGTIYLSGRWIALEDIIVDSGYVLMLPGNPGVIDRVVTSLGNTYTSTSSKYGTLEYMTDEGDQAKSYAFITSGAKNFTAAVTYDHMQETLRWDLPGKPTRPAFIDHRNSGVIKIYNQLFSPGTPIPAGTVHRFSGRYIHAYSPRINSTIDTI